MDEADELTNALKIELTILVWTEGVVKRVQRCLTSPFLDRRRSKWIFPYEFQMLKVIGRA